MAGKKSPTVNARRFGDARRGRRLMNFKRCNARPRSTHASTPDYFRLKENPADFRCARSVCICHDVIFRNGISAFLLSSCSVASSWRRARAADEMKIETGGSNARNTCAHCYSAGLISRFDIVFGRNIKFPCTHSCLCGRVFAAKFAFPGRNFPR